MKKIVVILSLLLLLPFLFYSAYQIYSLNETEVLLLQSYEQQMETILFSINQYCLDVVNVWAGKIQNMRTAGNDPGIASLIIENSAIEIVAVSDGTLQELKLFAPQSDIETEKLFKMQIRKTLAENAPLLSRLKGYQKQQYQKIEPLVFLKNKTDEEKYLLLVFASAAISGGLEYGIIVVRRQQFFNDIVNPKIAELTGNKIELVIFTEQEILSGDRLQLQNAADFRLRKKLWLFPNTYIGIRLGGQTIEQLAESRFRKNLFLIGLIELFILIIVVWIYRIMREKIELANMKSVFVSNVSHELRTPLSLIRMYAETLEMGRVKTDEKRQEYYHIISTETERLSYLVNNILNFSRIESGKKQFRFSTMDLNSIVTAVLENYRLKFDENGFDFALNLSDGVLNIEAEEEAVSGAIINLIDNAIKYSNDRKSVHITTGLKNSWIYFEIRDKGIGIDSRDRKKIFDKFYRVSEGLVHNTKGTGLGLTIVKHIMENHRGKIELESKPGAGSVFRLLFPEAQQNFAKETGIK